MTRKIIGASVLLAAIVATICVLVFVRPKHHEGGSQTGTKAATTQTQSSTPSAKPSVSNTDPDGDDEGSQPAKAFKAARVGYAAQLTERLQKLIQAYCLIKPGDTVASRRARVAKYLYSIEPRSLASPIIRELQFEYMDPAQIKARAQQNITVRGVLKNVVNPTWIGTKLSTGETITVSATDSTGKLVATPVGEEAESTWKADAAGRWIVVAFVEEGD